MKEIIKYFDKAALISADTLGLSFFELTNQRINTMASMPIANSLVEKI